MLKLQTGQFLGSTDGGLLDGPRAEQWAVFLSVYLKRLSGMKVDGPWIFKWPSRFCHRNAYRRSLTSWKSIARLHNRDWSFFDDANNSHMFDNLLYLLSFEIMARFWNLILVIKNINHLLIQAIQNSDLVTLANRQCFGRARMPGLESGLQTVVFGLMSNRKFGPNYWPRTA